MKAKRAAKSAKRKKPISTAVALSAAATNPAKNWDEAPVALVTGGSRGIGRAISIELGRLGFRVSINFSKSAAAAAETALAVGEAGGRPLQLCGDVAAHADRRHLIEETLHAFGRLDVLVNNAGIQSPGRKDLLEATEESWDAVFNTNLKGPFFLSQLAACEMIRLIEQGVIAGGKIINISSISAYTASTNRADYCMSKAALSMMTAVFASRLADEKIGVYEIRPGIIATDMTEPVKKKYDRLIDDGLSPIRRWGTPADVARAVAAIASDYFPFSTGEHFNVDGGFHLRRL